MGAVIRRFVRTADNSMILSQHGFPPPDISDRLEPAVGAQVIATCDAFDDPSLPITELLVGFDVAGDGGGGWEHLDIAYRVGSKHYVLEVAETIVRCGQGVDPSICTASQ